MKARGWLTPLALATALAAPTARAEPALVGPRLGASTDFAQTWAPDVMEASRQLPLAVLRDEIWWRNVETSDGRFVFDNPRTLYPERLGELDAQLMFLVNNPHPGHDGGTTPHTPQGAAAFARYTVQTLNRFPDIDIVEIGNEMNSETFAWGPGWKGEIGQRADSYVQLLKATATAVRKARPEAEILGGAAHSIPLAWLHEIFARGAAAHMDALVIHPYTVPPEQLARQIALLRQDVPGARDMPLAVTEFGTKDASQAPAFLMKSYCQQAISGVTWAIWYPLNPRGDGLAALLTPGGHLTEAGQVFRFLAATFEGRPAADIAPDPFTYGCRFGADWMVLWGAPRDITLAPGVQTVDPAIGQTRQPDGLRLSPDRPLVLHAPGGRLRLGHEVRLASHGIIADSWHQFAYPGAVAPPDPFQRLVRRDGAERPLTTHPGQERGGVPWTPYLGTKIDGLARMSAEWVLPAGTPARPTEIIHRYRAPVAQTVIPQLHLAPWEGGAALTVAQGDRILFQTGNVTPGTLSLAPTDLTAGEILDIVIGPNGTGGGTDLRITLQEAQP